MGETAYYELDQNDAQNKNNHKKEIILTPGS